MRATLFQSLDNIEIQNIIYITNRNEVADEDYDNWPADFINNFNITVRGDWQAFQSTRLRWIRLHANVVVPFPGPESEAVYPLDENGALDNDPQLSFVAAVISKRSGFAGRTNRGRWYMAGLNDADVFDEVIQDAEFARIQTFCNSFINLYGSDGTSSRFESVIYSHKDGDVLGEMTLAGMKNLVSLLPRRRVYTQRHRLQGHGS